MPSDIEPPTLFEVSQMSRDFGLVGERDTHLSVFLLTINGGLVIMSSPSRSGKDMVVDAVEYCMAGDEIAKIPSSTSKTVLYQRAEELNTSRIHRYPDITSLEEHIEQLLKDNGDGRESTHSFTDISGDERTEVSQTIRPPNAMILFAASDNQNVDLNDYPEVRNRAMVVSTDSSADLTSRIKTRQAEMEVGRYDQKVPQDRHDEIRAYSESIPVGLYTDDASPGEVWNLTHLGFDQENPLPDLFPESRMDFGRFNKFVKSVTLFKYENRMELNNEGRDATVSLLSAPEDLWMAWRVFGEKMVLSALNLQDLDFRILDLLRTSPSAMTVAEAQTEMRRQGHNLSEPQVRGSLNAMLDKGYVFKDNAAARVKFQPSPFATEDQVTKDISIDFEAIVEQTKKDARFALEPGAAEEYISTFCEGEGLIVTDPFDGTQISLTEQDLGDDVVEQAQQESEVIEETSPFESDDDPDDVQDKQEEQPFQGTIG
jgi:hypothetical protein